MISEMARRLRFLSWAVTAEATARRIGFGCALGATIGLIPKDNLITLTLVLLLFSLRVNILAGVLAAVVFTFVGYAMTPMLNHMGESVLSILPFQAAYARLYEAPLGPWTRFNNTVVAGGLTVGLLQFYPIYRLMTLYATKRLENWSEQCCSTDIGRNLLGRERVMPAGNGRTA